jgi:hypothetical protein
MSLPPSIAAALAEAHRRDLLSQAEACRLARTARRTRPQPARRVPRLMMTIQSRPAIVVAITLALACLITVGTLRTSITIGRSGRATTVAPSSSRPVYHAGSNGGASRTF